MSNLDQHNREIHENSIYWENKPLLRQVYHSFYTQIGQQVNLEIPGLTVELGSGLGKIKTVLPNCMTTDVFPNPWIDRVENAYHLSLDKGSVANLILFDVWHHLEFPGLALLEFQRVLHPQGRIIIFDPAMGLLGKFIYGNFHHEPLGLNQPLPWLPNSQDSFTEKYYAAQGNAWRMFRSKEYQRLMSAWKIRTIKYLSAFAYVASGGFRGTQLYPRQMLGAVNLLDTVLSLAPDLFATRMLVTLELR